MEHRRKVCGREVKLGDKTSESEEKGEEGEEPSIGRGAGKASHSGRLETALVSSACLILKG